MNRRLAEVAVGDRARRRHRLAVERRARRISRALDQIAGTTTMTTTHEPIDYHATGLDLGGVERRAAGMLGAAA